MGTVVVPTARAVAKVDDVVPFTEPTERLPVDVALRNVRFVVDAVVRNILVPVAVVKFTRVVDTVPFAKGNPPTSNNAVDETTLNTVLEPVTELVPNTNGTAPMFHIVEVLIVPAPPPAPCAVQISVPVAEILIAWSLPPHALPVNPPTVPFALPRCRALVIPVTVSPVVVACPPESVKPVGVNTVLPTVALPTRSSVEEAIPNICTRLYDEEAVSVVPSATQSEPLVPVPEPQSAEEVATSPDARRFKHAVGLVVPGSRIKYLTIVEVAAPRFWLGCPPKKLTTLSHHEA
jgi:hypothetical protein